MTNIKLHGELGKSVGKTDWRLAVKSVGEAMRAIEMLSHRKLYKFLLENDKKGVKYEVLINGREFLYDKPLDVNNLETVKNSELVAEFDDLKTIDIVPILEGADSNTGALILGIVLIIVGVVLAFTPLAPLAAPLIIAGIGLLAVGIIGLLSKPPEFEDFRAIEASGGKASYLFNGPQNTTREGGPVPVGYGRLLVGSQVISASYELINKDATVSALTT